jgi:hypothetical protein
LDKQVSTVARNAIDESEIQGSSRIVGQPEVSWKEDSRLVTICLKAGTRGIDRRDENHVTIATHRPWLASANSPDSEFIMQHFA